jgi:hypothetical protein
MTIVTEMGYFRIKMEGIMLTVEYKAAEKLATDIRNTDRAIDDALTNLAVLTQSVIDTARSSQIPPAKTQTAIEQVSIGISKMVAARKGFVGAHREIAILQRASNLQEVGFGCVGPGPSLRQSTLRVVSN